MNGRLAAWLLIGAALVALLFRLYELGILALLVGGLVLALQPPRQKRSEDKP